MSFLPHDTTNGLSWYGSLMASTAVHAGTAAFLLYSGMVSFQPETPQNSELEQTIQVSLEILDANIVEEPTTEDPLDDIPPDAPVLEPDLSQADELLEEDTAQDLLTPETDDAETLEPETQDLEPADTLADLDQLEPEITEPEMVEPEEALPSGDTETAVFEPEAIAPAAEESLLADTEEFADLAPEPPLSADPLQVIEPEPEQPTAIEAEAPAPLPVAPTPEPADPIEQLAVQDINPIEDDSTDFNPLMEAGSDALSPEPISPDLELALPDPGSSESDTAILNTLDTSGLELNIDPDASVATATDVATLTPDAVATPSDPDIIAPSVSAPFNDQGETLPEAISEPSETELALLLPEENVAEPDPDPGTSELAEPPESAVEETTPEGAEEIDTSETEDSSSQTGPQPIINPSPSDIALGELLRRIRTTSHEQCTLALPRRVTSAAGSDSPSAGVAFVGANSDVLDALSVRISTGLSFTPAQSREVIDPRQCATLDLIRQSDSYPANRIGLSLDAVSMVSGETLEGAVLGAGGLYVTLLLIDDNGVVQDMAPFTFLDGETPRFSAPVARTGPSRVTRQIILALGSEVAPLDISDRIGFLAEDVFTSIPSETMKSLVFGLATFDVR
ncbi:MAG: hypothetical protein GJ676_08810 [Rhodobacteraceae bacterium]|nr:hypothetical protein [Paracoccaceae bacterium]